MTRLFVALSLPEIVADALTVLQSGVDGARWRPFEAFHVTLAFIGETDRHGEARALDALSGVEAASFELTLQGADYFGGSDPRAVWAGIAACPPLIHLQKKVERLLRMAGFSLESRKFVPHVTLAYLGGVSADEISRYCAGHGLFKCGPFPVDAFHLYSSQLGGETSHYEIEASYALSSSM